MIHVGDCLEVMRTLDAASVDSIVTDPPYGLGFMGKGWDHAVPGEPYWLEAFRVAKPGAYLAAFGGTRTSHRMACAIEDAGWELRDTLMWVYGSGFPKSLDVSKAIDKAAGAKREILGEVVSPFKVDSAEGRRLAYGEFAAGINDGGYRVATITAPATEAASKWQGWGTALKPAWEPIILARKPLAGTVAANVLEHGTGGLNIDGCRVETDDHLGGGAYNESGNRSVSPCLSPTGMNRPGAVAGKFVQPPGRWPANLVHDGSEEVLACFPSAPGQRGDLTGKEPSRPAKNTYADMGAPREFKARRCGEASADRRYTDNGGTNFAPLPGMRLAPTSAARFFYCAKASAEDRSDGMGLGSTNNHPTVKPTDLMRWLCRLVTPVGGLVLDPFAGSGSTGRGAIAEGFQFVGIELDHEYARIAEARIRAVQPGLPMMDAMLSEGFA